MCWEDVRVGRNTWSQVQILQMPVAASPLIPASNTRVAIIFSGLGSSNGRICPSLPGITINNGFRLDNTGNQSYTFTLRDHGDIVRQPWYCIATGATTIVVCEVFLVLDPKKLLEYRDDDGYQTNP